MRNEKALKTYCTLHDDCLDSPELAEACAANRGAVIRVEKPSYGSRIHTVTIGSARYRIVRSTRVMPIGMQRYVQGVWYRDRWYLVLPEGSNYDYYGPLGGSTMLAAIDHLAREHGVSTSHLTYRPKYPDYPPKENPISSNPFVRAIGAIVAGVAIAYTASELKNVKNW